MQIPISIALCIPKRCLTIAIDSKDAREGGVGGGAATVAIASVSSREAVSLATALRREVCYLLSKQTQKQTLTIINTITMMQMMANNDGVEMRLISSRPKLACCLVSPAKSRIS